MKIDEEKLALYERCPKMYLEEIKRFDKEVWAQWNADYKSNNQAWRSNDLPLDEWKALMHEESRQEKLLRRVIKLRGIADKIEHQIFMRQNRQELNRAKQDLSRSEQEHAAFMSRMRRNPSPCNGLTGAFITSVVDFEMKMYLNIFKTQGEA